MRPPAPASLDKWRASGLLVTLAGAFAMLQPLSATVSAQTLVDRVLARVDSALITLSDVRAAVGLGIVDVPPGEDPDRGALLPLVERQVLLGELARFPAPEPTEVAIDELVATMKGRVGSRLPALMQATGIDEQQIRAVARDTLRMQGYVRQRFGATATLADPEVRQWLREARTRATVIEVK